MCARIRTAVEAAARLCGIYRRLPRDRLLESTRGAGQDASAAWHVTFQRKDSPGARIRIEVKALTGPRATCGGGSLLLVRRQGGVLPSVLWLSEGIRHPASSPRQRWRRQQDRVASTVGYQGTGCWGRPEVPDRVQVPRGGMERGSTSRVQTVHSPARYISKRSCEASW
jgi:hypothetical protein